MLFRPETGPLDFGQNNMGCQWQHSARTLMEPYYTPPPLVGPFASILATEIPFYRQGPFSPRNKGFSDICYMSLNKQVWLLKGL